MTLAQTRTWGARLTRYFRDPAVPAWRKWVGLLAAVYTVFPMDAVPDVIPLVGWLDDVGVLGVATWFVLREVRRHGERQSAEPSLDLRPRR